MKKIKTFDNKGFVLVETIVVAVFIIGICTFLFANFLPLIADYEKVSNYDDLTSKYKTHEIRKMILREISSDNEKRNIFTDYISNNYGYHRYGFKTETNTYELCDRLTNINYCNKLLSSTFLDVKEIIVVPFKLINVQHEIKGDKNIERELKDYIDYLPSYSKYTTKYDSYYRIIVIFNNGKIANIEVNYENI